MYVGEHLAGLESCIRDQKNRVIMHVTRRIIRHANRAESLRDFRLWHFNFMTCRAMDRVAALAFYKSIAALRARSWSRRAAGSVCVAAAATTTSNAP